MKNIILGGLLVLFSCTSNGQKNKVASPEKFEESIKSEKVQILDVRTADEYKSGHIKNSLQANWLNRPEFDDRTSHLDKSRPIFIYCLSGGRSGAAAEVLTERGYTVTNLEGGINAWKRDNRPLEGVDPNTPQTSISSYEGQVKSTSIVLVDFGAEWCPPCKKMEPVLKDFMNENSSKLTLIKMDGGIETALMKSLNVEALPTFILYKNGVEVKRKQGLVSKEEFSSWIK
jgi:thioredoxin